VNVRVEVLLSLIFQFLYLVFRAGAVPRRSRRNIIRFPLYLGWLDIAQGLTMLDVSRNVGTWTELQ
jgi:hypothetical protein